MNRDVDLLTAATDLVVGEPDLQQVLAGIARLLTETLAADGCLVLRTGSGGDLVAVAGHPEQALGADPLRLPRGFGVTGRVVADRIAVVLVDDNPRNPRHRALLGLRAGETVSRLCVPARGQGEACDAVLAVHSRARREFTADDIDAVQRVADLVALRIELDRSAGTLIEVERSWERLVDSTVAAQEAERRRIAGDLHDGVTQAITSLAFHLSAAEIALSAGDVAYVAEQVRAARELADLAVAETRSALSGLHSPVLDDLGLAAGLASMAHAIPNLRVDVDAQELDLPQHVETALFRIAQEAVSNIGKHAQAAKAVVRLIKHGRSVVLTVADDGRGFEVPPVRSTAERADSNAVRYGLAGMSDRVQLLRGQLSVTSRPGEGTTVEVVVPHVL